MDLKERFQRFQRLWDIHGEALRRKARRTCPDEPDDAVQELMNAVDEVVRTYPDINDFGSLGLLACKSAHRKLIDMRRTRLARPDVTTMDPADLDERPRVCPELQAVDARDSIEALHGKLRPVDSMALELLLSEEPVHRAPRGTRKADVAVGLGLTRHRAQLVFRRLQHAAVILAIL